MPRTLPPLPSALEPGQPAARSKLEAIAQLERPRSCCSPLPTTAYRGGTAADRLDAAWVRLQAIWADYRAQANNVYREASVAMAERLLSEVPLAGAEASMAGSKGNCTTRSPTAPLMGQCR